MKKLFFGVVICLFSGAIWAQQTILYKISGNGLSKPSYVYGTMHITCDAKLESATLEALKNTTQLYLELDMDDPTMQATMMTGMLMKDKTIKSMVAEADWKLLDDFMSKKLGMSAMLINNMKPAMLTTLLTPGMLDCPMQSIEEALMKVAKDQKKEILGLESIAEQMAIFDAIPYETQIEELLQIVKNFSAAQAELKQLMAVYQSKDLDALSTHISKQNALFNTDFQQVILDERNSKWIPLIERVAKEKPTFFGVGAGHLPGAKGVLSLLRQKGYVVEPVL